VCCIDCSAYLSHSSLCGMGRDSAEFLSERECPVFEKKTRNSLIERGDYWWFRFGNVKRSSLNRINTHKLLPKILLGSIPFNLKLEIYDCRYQVIKEGRTERTIRLTLVIHYPYVVIKDKACLIKQGIASYYKGYISTKVISSFNNFSILTISISTTREEMYRLSRKRKAREELRVYNLHEAYRKLSRTDKEFLMGLSHC
jgi:hypothetical protein